MEQCYTVAFGNTHTSNPHLGDLREPIIANSKYKESLAEKKNARLIYINYDVDALQEKEYPEVPESFIKKYCGYPIFRIPDPFGCCHTYEEHYASQYYSFLKDMGIQFQKFNLSDIYRDNGFKKLVIYALNNENRIKKILNRENTIYFPLCKNCGKYIKNHVVVSHNTVLGVCESCGKTSYYDFMGLRGKLCFRVEWPILWKFFGVSVEPYGRSHSSPNGTAETAKKIFFNLFDESPPELISWEWVLTKETGAMRSSKGNILSLKQIQDFIDPVLMKSFMESFRPEDVIEFDPKTFPQKLDAKLKKRNGEEYKFSLLYRLLQGIETYEFYLAVLPCFGIKRRVYAERFWNYKEVIGNTNRKQFSLKTDEKKIVCKILRGQLSINDNSEYAKTNMCKKIYNLLFDMESGPPIAKILKICPPEVLEKEIQRKTGGDTKTDAIVV